MVLLHFGVNTIVSFQFSTIHNWHRRAPRLPLVPWVGCEWQEAGTSSQVCASSLWMSLVFCWLLIPRCPRWIMLWRCWMCWKGSFYCICSFSSLYVLFIPHFGEKVGENDSFLLPTLFLARGWFKQWLCKLETFLSSRCLWLPPL